MQPAWRWISARLPLLTAASVQLLVVLCVPVIPMNDTLWYLSQTFGFAFTHPADFYSVVQPPAHWEVTYPPGLPWLWDLLMLALSRGWVAGFVALQHVLRLASVAILQRMGEAEGRPSLGWWVALAYALHVRSAIYCQALLSETLFTFLLVLGLYALAHGGRRAAGLGGCALALGAVLVRLLVVAPVALAAWYGWVWRRQHRRTVLQSRSPVGDDDSRPAEPGCEERPGGSFKILAVSTFAAVVVLLLWNGGVFGRWAPGTHVGRHAFDRAFCMGDFTAPGDPAYERLLALGRPVGTDPRGASMRSLQGVYWYQMYPLLRGQGLSLDKADDLMGRAGHAALRRQPLRFAATVLADLIGTSEGRVMGPDVFIPDWLVRAGERPPPDRDPWLISGASAGAPAEVAARQAFMDTAWVPRAAPLPADARRWGLALLDSLPEWNGAFLWLVLAGSVLAFRRGGSPPARAIAVLFWTALLFPVVVHGPLPRYYTALVPLALWLALGACQHAGRRAQHPG